MSSKKVAVGLAIAIPWIITILIAVADLGCRIRTQRMNTEFGFTVPALTYFVNEYTRRFIENGHWPEPGTIYDDSAFNYRSTHPLDGGRIDVYETMNYRQVEVHLMDDGAIYAYEVQTQE